MNLYGISQGVLQGQDAMRAQAEQRLQDEQRRQQMQMQALQLETARQGQARDQQARQNAQYAVAGSNGGPQPPSPGQSSQPMMPPSAPPPQVAGAMPPPGMGQPKPAIPPYQTVDAPRPPAAQPMAGPPPIAQQTPPDPSTTMFAGASALDTAMQNMQKHGIPFDQQLDVINNPEFAAYLSAKDKDRLYELNAKKEANQAGKLAADEAYRRSMEQTRQDQEAERERHDRATEHAAGQRINISLDKATAGGALGKGQLDPETVDYYAKQSLAGDNSWQVGLARGKVGQQLIAAVKDRIPKMAKETGQTPTDAIANKAETAALSTAMKKQEANLAATQQFVKNMDSQIKLVEKYMPAGAAGTSPVINKWIQNGRTAVAGDPDVTALDTALRGLAREHQRIVTGVTSNAQLHVAAQSTADELLNRAQSPAQMRAAIKVMREEIDNAVASGKSEVSDLRKQMSGMGKGDAGGKVMSLDEYLTSKGH